MTWLMSEEGEAVLAMQRSASLPFVADTEAKQRGVWLIFTAMQPHEEMHAVRNLSDRGPAVAQMTAVTGTEDWSQFVIHMYKSQIMKFNLQSLALA